MPKGRKMGETIGVHLLQPIALKVQRVKLTKAREHVSSNLRQSILVEDNRLDLWCTLEGTGFNGVDGCFGHFQTDKIRYML
jgi:hypothetical protein